MPESRIRLLDERSQRTRRREVVRWRHSRARRRARDDVLRVLRAADDCDRLLAQISRNES